MTINHQFTYQLTFLNTVFPILMYIFPVLYSTTVDSLFWFFGGFRCGVPLFIVMLVIYKYKNR